MCEKGDIMKCRRFIFLRMPVLILVILLIISWAGCITRRQKPDQLEEKLLSQIDWKADDYLASADEDQKDILSFKSLCYGSFTDSSSSELLALFHASSPHVGGLDRTIAAVYDKETMLIKTQETFAADQVSLYLFSDISGKDNILFIGETTNQGLSSYHIELVEVRENEWVSKPISDEQFEDNYTYAVANNELLHVFSLSYNEFKKPSFQYKYTLFWDENEGKFSD
jgi:hypothetical protein